MFKTKMSNILQANFIDKNFKKNLIKTCRFLISTLRDLKKNTYTNR